MEKELLRLAPENQNEIWKWTAKGTNTPYEKPYSSLLAFGGAVVSGRRIERMKEVPEMLAG